MATATVDPTLLDKLLDQRSKLVDEWSEFIDARESDRTKFDERQQSDEFKALATEKRQAEIEAYRTAEAEFKDKSDAFKRSLQGDDENDGLDQRIEHQRDIASRRADAADASKSPSVTITDEPHTYRWDTARGENGYSYYTDLAVRFLGVNIQGYNQDHSTRRLDQHGREMDVAMPKRAQKREMEARSRFEEAERAFWESQKDRRIVERLKAEFRGGMFNPFEMRVEPNLAQGQGGFFVPPLWLVDEYIPGLRPHRVVASLMRNMPLPPGTSSINIPKLSTLTQVGYQQMNNSGLPSRDFTDSAVTANVKTMGGFEDVAIQELELSPGNIVDEVITTDLVADHDRFVDSELIAGDGLNAASLNGGHLIGIYNSSGTYSNNGSLSGGGWSGTNTVTYTDGSPSPSHLANGVFGPMWSKIATNRFAAGLANDMAFVTHPSRNTWYSAGLDVNGRPLGETLNGGPFNTQARIEAGLPAEGLATTLPYLSDAPVYITGNVPTTDTTGGGTSQDIAIGGLWNDAWLFESELRTDVFREVLSGSLGVRFRLFGYKAFAVRYGQSFAVATGSGFARPATPYGDFYR